MKTIENRFFEGERPLFAASDIQLINVKFYPGESAVKESDNVYALNCEFMGKYPFWHNSRLRIEDSLFTQYSRAALWYCKDVHLHNTRVEAPKMFREINGLSLEKVTLEDALESVWYCRNIKVKDVKVKNGDYVFKNCNNVTIDNLKLQGNYSFQYTKNVEIRNADIQSKDAFWNSENVTVYDSVIEGEYLGWHSKNLRLVNCIIGGTQPLCYAENLIMENCRMNKNADLAFEYSRLRAEINSDVTSVKNPEGGEIIAWSVGEIIMDENCRNTGACKIRVENEVTA